MRSGSEKRFSSLIPSTRSGSSRQGIFSAPPKTMGVATKSTARKSSVAQTEGRVLMTEDDFNLSSKVGTDCGMCKDYARAINFLNSCHKYINNMTEKTSASTGDKNNLFFLPTVINYAPMFPWLVGGQKNPVVVRKKAAQSKPSSPGGKGNPRKPSTIQHERKPSPKADNGVGKEEIKDILKGHLDDFLQNLHNDLGSTRRRGKSGGDAAPIFETAPTKRQQQKQLAKNGSKRTAAATGAAATAAASSAPPKRPASESTDSPSPTRSTKPTSSKTSSSAPKRYERSKGRFNVSSPCPPLPATPPEPLRVETHEEICYKFNHDVPRREGAVKTKSFTTLTTATSMASSTSTEPLTDSSRTDLDVEVRIPLSAA